MVRRHYASETDLNFKIFVDNTCTRSAENLLDCDCGYDEIDYIEEILDSDAKLQIKKIDSRFLRDRYERLGCSMCTLKKKEATVDHFVHNKSEKDLVLGNTSHENITKENNSSINDTAGENINQKETNCCPSTKKACEHDDKENKNNLSNKNSSENERESFSAASINGTKPQETTQRAKEATFKNQTESEKNILKMKHNDNPNEDITCMWYTNDSSSENEDRQMDEERFETDIFFNFKEGGSNANGGEMNENTARQANPLRGNGNIEEDFSGEENNASGREYFVFPNTQIEDYISSVDIFTDINIETSENEIMEDISKDNRKNDEEIRNIRQQNNNNWNKSEEKGGLKVVYGNFEHLATEQNQEPKTKIENIHDNISLVDRRTYENLISSKPEIHVNTYRIANAQQEEPVDIKIHKETIAFDMSPPRKSINEAINIRNDTMNKPSHKVRRFVLETAPQQLALEDCIRIQDLKTADLTMKLEKRGKNGRYQRNFFRLKGNELFCYNGRKTFLDQESRNLNNENIYVENYGNFYYTKKYSLNILNSRVYLVKNTSYSNPLARALSICCAPKDELIDITHSTISNIVSLGSGYNIHLSGSRIQSVYVPILEISIQVNDAFYFYRISNPTHLLRFTIALGFRHGRYRLPEY